MKRLGVAKTIVLVCGWLLCLLLMAGVLGCEKKSGERVFRLKGVSAFDVVEQSTYFVRGHYVDCGYEPEAGVKYPVFQTEKPIYGSVRFDMEYGEKYSGTEYHFAIDESGGTGGGYDRFYFDLDRDLDLQEDRPLAEQKRPPEGAKMRYTSIEQEVCFDYLDVNFDFGPEGERSLEIMPRLMISESGYTRVAFVATKVYKGRIKVAGERYDVLLGHSYPLGGRFDRPSTTLLLFPRGDSKRLPTWWGAEQLMAIHKIGGTYYRFSATPRGNKLIVRPYSGELGRFEIGPGGRDIREMGIQGSLHSEDAAVAVGGKLEYGRPTEARSCEIPVGDYLPEYITVNLGRLFIAISYNYHSDGKPRDRGGRPHVYGINVRRDKPYILDFSNKPEVMFALPAKDGRVKLGDELKVKAILTDPELDFMIRGFNNTRRKERKEYGKGPDGEAITYEEDVSLDPRVLITRANGEKVAEGVMPFG